MCGIVGIINRGTKSIQANLLQDMLDTLRHRGPDGEDITILHSGAVGLGHRRLAIIDLTERARQPMQTEDRRYTITYNGEIYNYRELREELQNCGYYFASESDTEVVLKAYACWGEQCLNRFNGMFAFAIWDEKEQKIFIARDRYGIKPLYYAWIKDSFVFASEQKAIIKHPLFRRNINLKVLKEYFTFQNIFTNRTFFEDIYILEPGTFISIPLDGNEKEVIKRYWDFQFQEEDDRQEEEYEEELKRLFEQAVRRQLVSDVPLGTFLSGGMDSGSITAIAARDIPYIKSFTCGFDVHSVSGLEQSFDEREKAEYLSYLLKTEHYEMVLKAGDMERIMQRLVWHLEDPRIGQSYPNMYVDQLASKFVKVALSGAGGDELFGGYPWRYYRSVDNKDFNEYIEKYYGYWQRLIPEEQMPELFAPVWDNVKYEDEKDIFKQIFKNINTSYISNEQCINYSLYMEAKTFLHGLLLVEDRLSMAYGLEVRVPFLDNDLVDFAMKLPVKYKIRNLNERQRIDENDIGKKAERYYVKTNDGKFLLRKSMNRILPKDITKAVKQGFSAPDASWFRGESIDYVKEIVYSDSSKIYGYLDKNKVRSIVDAHIRGEENRRLFIWSILNFEEWCKIFL